MSQLDLKTLGSQPIMPEDLLKAPANQCRISITKKSLFFWEIIISGLLCWRNERHL